MLLVKNDLGAAGSYYLRALEVLEQQIGNLGGSYDVQAEFRAQHRDFYREAMELLLRQGRVAHAFHVLERFRARTFLTMLAERDIAFKVDLPEELDRKRRLLAVKHDRTLRRLAGFSILDDMKEVDLVRHELEAIDGERDQIEEMIRRASPKLAALRYPQPLTAELAQEALDPGTLLLSYVVGVDATTIFALSREEGVEVRTVHAGETALREKILDLRDLVPEATSDTLLGRERIQALRDLGQELYQLLIEPFAERIGRSERLLLLPDGPLHGLPFGALSRRHEDGSGEDQFLLEWMPFHITLSVTTYTELKKRRSLVSGPGVEAKQVVAFGDPSYPGTVVKRAPGAQAVAPALDAVVRSVSEREGLDFDWKSLPYTRREVEGIAELFPERLVRVFLGFDALEERVKALGADVGVLHLAAHAVMDDHQPLSSFIALTIPADPVDGRDNGLLQAWEILEQVRLDADLVVLSGCLTGMGKELRGEGLIGLTRAFQYAGARSMISTLWNVSDQATAEIMLRFYQFLRSGLTKDEALRSAQIEMLRGRITSIDADGLPQELSHASAPYYWAGFQLYGDWM